MEKIELEAKKRTSRGKKNQLLRTAGLVPGVIYGRGVKSEPVEVEAKVLQRVYSNAGGNKILAAQEETRITMSILPIDGAHKQPRAGAHPVQVGVDGSEQVCEILIKILVVT